MAKKASSPPIAAIAPIVPTLGAGSIRCAITGIVHLPCDEYIIDVDSSLLATLSTAHSSGAFPTGYWESRTFPWGTNKRCVYYFEIIKGSVTSIAASYIKSKGLTDRAFSYYNGTGTSTNSLYVGKYHSGCIRQRIKEHFGFGNEQTGALQLHYWLTTEKLKLHIYAFDDKTEPDIINAIEKLLIAHHKPLIGKD